MAYPTRKQIENVIAANAGAGKAIITTKIQEFMTDFFPDLTGEEKSRVLNDLNSYHGFTIET